MEIKTFSLTSHKIKAVVYGKSGSGKTYFAATAPKPIFASAEGGLMATVNHKKKIARPEYVKISSLDDLKDMLMSLKRGGHGFETVVIDSITEINEIAKDAIEKSNKGRKMQLNDWGDLAKTIKKILREFRDLDMHVIFIAQQKEEKDGDTVTAFVPSLNGKAATEIAYFMDIVAYSFIDRDGVNRLTTQPSEKLVTKSRGIEFDGYAPDDFEEWIKIMSKIELREEEVRIIETPKSPTPLKVPEKPATTSPRPAPKANPNNPPTPQEVDRKALLADLFKQWNTFFQNTGRNMEKSLPSLKATVQKEFALNEIEDLSNDQILGFSTRLLAQNERTASEQKKLKEVKK